jgi:hypothetical protein
VVAIQLVSVPEAEWTLASLCCSRPWQRKYRLWCLEHAYVQRSHRDDGIAANLEFTFVRTFGTVFESNATSQSNDVSARVLVPGD